ncbi:kunitz-type protease inhibitor 2 [Sphaeramia orbicularis]|uniref:kunitz-type protease inhibitor 2 n=1 Tax=Sphaeramia orbicularis TaxID=375764 RepID=UPI00117D9C5C|nr:kunitz-type serine protease inhibitor 6-like [Sphaeramia orbicularis]
MGARTLLLTLCVLVWPGPVRLCDWNQTVAPDQGLDPVSLQSGAFYLNTEQPVSGPDQCREACCSRSDCDLALVGYPQDGDAHCFLVHCFNGGRDVCALQSSSQFKVFKKVNPEDRNQVPDGPDGEAEQRVQPRLVQWAEDTTLRDPRAQPDGPRVLCRLPMKVGSCRAAFPRFFYNVTDQTCRRFTYGGCDANSNNFETKEECESTCSGVTGVVLPEDSTPAPESGKAPRMAPPFRSEDKAESSPDEPKAAVIEPEPAPTKEVSADDYAERCKAELQVGPCRAAFQRWYFNSLTGRCQRFIYGGCKGNKNNYENEESCRSMCTGVTVLPSSKKIPQQKDDEASDYEENCMVTSDPGPCRAAFPAFYYDHKTSTCRSFTYGGCRGNKNRYNTMEECTNRCSQGAGDTHALTRNRWTAAFFLFFTMAAISVLLLATLIIITLKRRRLTRRSSSVNDKEELLPDPDGSSLESLSLPETPTVDRA